MLRVRWAALVAIFGIFVAGCHGPAHVPLLGVGPLRAGDPTLFDDTITAVRAAGQQDYIVADGTSCRHQIRDLAGREAIHSVHLLDQALS